jgi:hypothetical protein
MPLFSFALPKVQMARLSRSIAIGERRQRLILKQVRLSSSLNVVKVILFSFDGLFVFKYNKQITKVNNLKGFLSRILFFGTNKEILTNIVETFISLLYPLEYQYPYISILPDAYCSLIEREKSFVFGVNHRLIWEGKDKVSHPTYFKNMHLNVHNKLFLICDTDTNSIYKYNYHDKLYHIVNFNDLGVYPEIKDGDISQCVSKDINSDIIQNVIDINLPEKITYKITKDLNNYLIKNYEFIRDNHDYSEEINTKIVIALTPIIIFEKTVNRILLIRKNPKLILLYNLG